MTESNTKTVTLRYPCGHTAVVPASTLGWLFSQPKGGRVQVIDAGVAFLCPHDHGNAEAPFIEVGTWLALVGEETTS